MERDKDLVPKRYRQEATAYFDVFRGEGRLMGEMGIAEPAAQVLLNEGRFVGQHCFVPQEDGSITNDIYLTIPQEVERRKRETQLRETITELKSFLPTKKGGVK